MLRKYSATAETITSIRWKFIDDYFGLKNIKNVLDYGSGVGWFRAFRPQGIDVDSFDIGNFPQTGIQLKVYDVVCFWDVLEHIENFIEIEPILRLARSVVCTIPIRPVDVNPGDWKHFKPGEHLHYFDADSLATLLNRYGFDIEYQATPECPPRVDIHSFIFNSREGGLPSND
jgi:hypothetical protein